MLLKTKSPDFKGQVFYVGIDTHKSNWKVSIRTRDIHLRTFSMNPSPEELSKHMNHHYPNGTYVSTYEAGFCGYWIHRKLSDAGFKNIIVNPADVPSTNKERNNKSDPIDSAKLSRERANDSLTGIFIPDEHHEALRSLNRLYKQNARRTTQLKNRMKSYLSFTGIEIPDEFSQQSWSYNFLKFLGSIQFSNPLCNVIMNTHIEDLLHTRKTRLSILQHIRTVSNNISIIQLLRTIPGIGLLTAFTVYAELVDIFRFKNFDNLASYVGLIPSIQSSDDTTRVRGITNRHCKHLRNALIESAWVAIRKDEALLYAFNQLIKRMKKADAIIRIAKKLLNRIRFVWKSNTQYVNGILEASLSSK